jgi:hypothetical protein
MGMTKTQSARPVRQFCRKCLSIAVPAVTLNFGPNLKLHWCTSCADDADGYRQQAD